VAKMLKPKNGEFPQKREIAISGKIVTPKEVKFRVQRYHRAPLRIINKFKSPKCDKTSNFGNFGHLTGVVQNPQKKTP
jgi:hypothetical protein